MSRFDKAAKAWVEKHVKDHGEVIEESVEFFIDAAAYASAAWCKFEVTWNEFTRYYTVDGKELPPGLKSRSLVIDEDAWKYDATDLMRELTEWEEGKSDGKDV